MNYDPQQIQCELQHAYNQCSERGLIHTAKWCAEQLVGLNDTDVVAAAQRASSTSLPAPEEIDPREQNLFLLAKSVFDLKEYTRCFHFLRNATSKKGLFLKYYALYMAGEKRKEEQTLELAGADNTISTLLPNPNLEEVHTGLCTIEQQHQGDPFLSWLHGLVLKQRDQSKAAVTHFASAVAEQPCLWCAWQELANLCVSNADLDGNKLGLPTQHWVYDFFMASLLLEWGRCEEVLERYSKLEHIFPHSNYVRSQVAITNYDLKDYQESQVEFEEVLAHDPYQLEYIDIFSNILYVNSDKTSLSHLAHKAFTTDRFKPQTNCIIGNYYSLKSQHEKAVVYFQRALRVDPMFLSAWTLMGHEYVELKNTQAAVDAYRHAVDISPRDYRAWYGLGQTYEILQLYYYALHYYRKAANLRPTDARMWSAMGGCYEQLQRKLEGIKCYQRAVANGDPEGVATSKLAQLYESLGLMHKAAKCYLKFKPLQNSDEASEQECSALLFLVNYYKNEKCYDEAEQYCRRLLDQQGTLREQAKALQRELHHLRSQNQPRAEG
eukprot:TRINITY_DN30710_c0_g1_i1.p1 TRINITY_DN30710_c0_g1~~TRINITY_DN30710_c0_g1_i1.p1  ORF type:complete len:551 (+),score=45.36 TRINITY_DN30710_c0_g1_i1:95-1747(+)